MTKTIRLALLTSTLLTGAAWAQDVTLTIESWRNDDLAIWQEKIIPAFEAANPGIKINFAPSAPPEYNAVLNSKLDAGSAGDLITCRPFDASLELFKKGKLADLSDLAAMANFSDVAKSAWQTDDGAQTFCVPMASVIHGFIYNKTAFDELGLTPPRTEAEFFALLDKIKEDGTYIPMAMGTADQWEAATMGYQNIGPNYWHGEEGRKALIEGTSSLTDDGWVAPFRQLAKWKDYLGDGFEAQTYPDSQNLFTLGRAAIYPAGSWEIGVFGPQIGGAFEMGAFPPPVPAEGDTCYISDHTDIALGMNAATKHPEEARKFLEWVGSSEFASLYANALPGFFSLNSAPVEMEDPLAREFVGWRETCEPTIRSTYQILSRGTPNLENETWTASANVITGAETPEAAAERLQQGLAAWHAPQQK
ncbi:ABC transporter substrate-binding protein [Paracoccus denitrificans]|jgi:raffinose/stachyose/melibiose transport system substrate-binding protein|uniref:Probable sugar-binding periplasmic protein n=1 Tax=Paracoccus denitrificans (strain Pd 1222) TaxID=318586 RepID=A1B4W5_PARDP|nr:ABC transporter substrate-binding protein [Paracoccus denitrificans]ABL70559.1 carbohydrate ABC transporter substrate-binding protein, CUT1 family [Paracoccus denitrificans PD1222]MBB4627442.1 raffinose/stachyose/melibiose transport system substrate-binding protein [Paracoccus denitrificans]MCU7429411.1 ABC transporter substrate-binding protein [Paracoccus denitrificans]QAR25893.1 carbohydrate ABC transporter substrate-binding protein [Paracoccus denitrificans]UPV94799.1 ABC transporter sub